MIKPDELSSSEKLHFQVLKGKGICAPAVFVGVCGILNW